MNVTFIIKTTCVFSGNSYYFLFGKLKYCGNEMGILEKRRTFGTPVFSKARMYFSAVVCYTNGDTNTHM